MEGALFSTVYRGCLFSVASRSPPLIQSSNAFWGSSSSLSLSPRSGSRAVGSLLRGKVPAMHSVFRSPKTLITHRIRDAPRQGIRARTGRGQ